MLEIYGDLWEYLAKQDTTILITTNGTITKTGRCVMGRGCAAEAKSRFPGIELELGRKIWNEGGNVVHSLQGGLILSFPVKHQWHEMADLVLIVASAWQLRRLANANPGRVYVLPRPGCGNGRLHWQEVHSAVSFLPDNVKVIDNGFNQHTAADYRRTDSTRTGGPVLVNSTAGRQSGSS